MQKLITSSASVLIVLNVASSVHGQQLKALGVSGSFNIARLHSGQSAFQLGSVTVDPQ